MTEYYVYAHIKMSDGSVFYVGKGKGRRAYAKSGRNSLWSRIAKKHGHTVWMLHTGLTEDEAFALEKSEILRFSPECNFTDGGEGISGYRHTEETKRALSVAHSGRSQAPEVIAHRAGKLRGLKRSKEHCERQSVISKGLRHSDETREKMRVAHTGRKQTPEAIAKVVAFHTGKTRSDEARKRMSEAQPKRKVICVDNGQLFESITDAAEWLKVNGWPSATKTGVWFSLQGKRQLSYGYRWSYCE